MSNGAAKSIGIIVNVVAVGAMTLTLGIWISNVAKDQQTLAKRLAVIESNQKKIADSINSKLNASSASESKVRLLEQNMLRLKSDHAQLKTESTSRTDSINSNLSDELKTLESRLRKGQDALKSELLQLVRDEMVRTSTSTIDQSRDVNATDLNSNELEGVIESIKALADKSFLKLYALPTEGGRSKGFVVTDNGEAFYVDRSNNAIISAWDSVHKTEYQQYIRELLAKSYRHRKEELEKAILAEVPVDIEAELKATNIGSSLEVNLHSIDGTPTYNESYCRMKAILSAGPVLKPVLLNLPYCNLPGVVQITSPISPTPTQTPTTTAAPLTDSEIIDAIRKVSNSSSAITQAYVFPKRSAQEGVVYAFSSGSSPQLFIIDSANDLVLPVHKLAFSSDAATAPYKADYKLVLREAIQDALDNHRDKIHQHFLTRYANSAAKLEKQVLSGSVHANVADVKFTFPSEFQAFPQSVSASVTLQAGNLAKQINSSIDCTDLPNMRLISR